MQTTADKRTSQKARNSQPSRAMKTYFSLRQNASNSADGGSERIGAVDDSSGSGGVQNISSINPYFQEPTSDQSNNNFLFWQYICAALSARQQMQSSQTIPTPWLAPNWIANSNGGGAFTPTANSVHPMSQTSNLQTGKSESSADQTRSHEIVPENSAHEPREAPDVKPVSNDQLQSDKKHRKRSYKSDRMRGVKVCKECNVTYGTKEEFWVHNRQVHDDGKLNRCPACVFSTKFKHHYDYHLRGHIRSKPYRCTKCDYRCINQSMLRSHISSHRRELRNRCRICNDTFKTLKALEQHMVSSNHPTPQRDLKQIPVTNSGFRMLQALADCCNRSSNTNIVVSMPESAAELSEQLNDLLNKSKLTGVKEIVDDALFDDEYAEQVVVEAEMYAQNLSSHLYCDRCEFCASTKDEIISHLKSHVENAKPGEIFSVPEEHGYNEGSEAGALDVSDFEDEHKSSVRGLLASSSSPLVSTDTRPNFIKFNCDIGFKHEPMDIVDEVDMKPLLPPRSDSPEPSFRPSSERKHRRKETKPTKLTRASVRINGGKPSLNNRFTSSTSLSCNLCWIHFEDTCSYLTHLSLHNPGQPLCCTKCGYLSHNFQEFRDHCNGHNV